ncbi:proline-rich protein HaeIII subfamily 1-like [Heterocephalus glaber]|uniref:Proline-rich protein HaeIII subfamily 1-like n=1 Tax=Heterocephalus glaber TaxID=10181 RepID=A0AAX6SVJ3_HETGA|nr:proline-rich protein HaeIII subfamily 1-like [Heterocephalus glaber]
MPPDQVLPSEAQTRGTCHKPPSVHISMQTPSQPRTGLPPAHGEDRDGGQARPQLQTRPRVSPGHPGRCSSWSQSHTCRLNATQATRTCQPHHRPDHMSHEHTTAGQVVCIEETPAPASTDGACPGTPGVQQLCLTRWPSHCPARLGWPLGHPAQGPPRPPLADPCPPRLGQDGAPSRGSQQPPRSEPAHIPQPMIPSRGCLPLPTTQPGNFTYPAHARPSVASARQLEGTLHTKGGGHSGQPAPGAQPDGLGDGPHAPRLAHPAWASAALNSTHGGRSLPARLGLQLGRHGRSGGQASPPSFRPGGPRKQAEARKGQRAGLLEPTAGLTTQTRPQRCCSCTPGL